MNIGLRIKELRDKKNMSQEDLADLIGVTKQMISHYEGGINVPRGAKIKKIAEVFGITEEEFYTSKSTSNFTNTDDTSKKWEQEYWKATGKIDLLESQIIKHKENEVKLKDKLGELGAENDRLYKEIEKLQARIPKKDTGS